MLDDDFVDRRMLDDDVVDVDVCFIIFNSC